MNRSYLFVFYLFILLVFLIFPKDVSAGAADGLLLWSNTVFPSLFPFLLIIGLIESTEGFSTLSKIAVPIYHTIYSKRLSTIYPLVLGHSCGYPIGAKLTARLYQRRQVTRDEAMHLLPIANMPNPAFLINYVFINSLHITHNYLPYLAIIYLTPALYYRFINLALPMFEKISHGLSLNIFCCSTDPPADIRSKGFSDIILDSFITMGRLGGTIIFFSSLYTLAANNLILPSTLKTLLLCPLELATGIHTIAISSFHPQTKLLICTFLSSFGGFAILAQTAGFLKEAHLSVINYTIHKLAMALLSTLLLGIYAGIFP